MNLEDKVTEGFADTLQRSVINRTGYLQVHDTTGERRGRVFLEYGDVVAILVDGYQPRLARRLTASGFVSAAGMLEVLSVVQDDYDPRIAVECVTRGLVEASIVQALNREFMLSAAVAVDGWEIGDSRWVAGVAPWEGRSTPVTVPQLIFAMARRREHWARIWAGLSTATLPDRVPVRTRLAEYQPENADEAAILWAVDGERTVDEVAGECGFTRFQAGHVLAGLMTKKVLDLLPDPSPPGPDSLPVEAEYVAPPARLPTALPSPETTPPTQDTTQETTPQTQEATQDTAPEAMYAVATGPVAADNPEGNVVTQQNEVEATGGHDERQPAESDRAATTPVATSTPALEPSLGDFFATPLEPTRGPEADPCAEPPRHTLDLPPLPFIGGDPSDFYAVPQPLGSGAAGVEPGPQPADQLQEEVPRAAPTAQELALDAEVTQLREDLLLLATQRNTVVEQASLLRGQAAAQSSEAEAAGIRAEEAGAAMATGRRKVDEASSAHAILVRDLQDLIGAEETIIEAWEVAKAEAVASNEGARQAEATLTACEEQMDKARKRLIELAW